MTKKIKVASTSKKIQDIIEKHEAFKTSYFWNGNNKSSHLNWATNFSFKFNNKKYNIEQSCSSSSKNVYYNLAILVDGTKKDIRALKAVI